MHFSCPVISQMLPFQVWVFQTLPIKIAYSYTADKQETFIHDWDEALSAIIQAK